MQVIFKNNYSDVIGSFRRGWKRDLPTALAKQLISSGVAEAAVATPPTPPAPTGGSSDSNQPAAQETPKPKRARRQRKTQPASDAHIEQYVTPSAPATPTATA
jgi:hypothetical protein